MRVLYAVSEFFPFSKTGGLADVAGALPAALARLGHDVRVVTPDYPIVRDTAGELEPAGSLTVGLPKQSFDFTLSKRLLPEGPVEILFLGNDGLFNRPGLYQEKGRDFPDNHLRFAAFSRAILEIPDLIGWVPDVIHGNDWQTGLVFAYLRAAGEGVSVKQAGTVFTIHNLGFQGIFPFRGFSDLGLPLEFSRFDSLEYHGNVNFIKAGLVYSDLLTVVSPTYAREILTPEFGSGLDGLLRMREKDLSGIVNGVDYRQWDPRHDKFIPKKYTRENLAGKLDCKFSLQKECGLTRGHVPLLGMVARLTHQKGFHLVLGAMEELMQLDLQIVILGSGDSEIEEDLKRAGARYPKRLAVRTGFDESLAHRIEAGADIFLMPSLYEPCGLNQLYSLRYGTIPIVRKTGGLADTVVDALPSRLKSGEATGFVFTGTTSSDLVNAVRIALSVYADRRKWRKMMRTAMTVDFSWDRSAREYEWVYQKALDRARGRPPAEGMRRFPGKTTGGEI